MVTAATTACAIQLTTDVNARMATVARSVKLNLASGLQDNLSNCSCTAFIILITHRKTELKLWCVFYAVYLLTKYINKVCNCV